MTRRRFAVGASPTRQPLQPEATGAVMEVTKWLKTSECVSRIGDSASVQAVTRVIVKNLEIGQPINSEKCSETAAGVARDSKA
jgi:hypothetical protein